MAEQIQMSVNHSRLIEVLKHSFSTQSTFIGELLQNSRRAGANQIDMRLDAEPTDEDGKARTTLTISDDGRGIADWAGLISIAESGWDETTQATEQPFGIGFLSALFAARHVDIRSGAQQIACPTEDILDIQPITQSDTDDTINGTRIQLAGIAADVAALRAEIAAFVAGFPLPVTLDGEPLDRPDARDADFADTEVGAIYIAPEVLRRRLRYRPDLYLQGLPIESHRVFRPVGRSSVIVHLDSTQFTGRLPDRDTLIDSSNARQMIHHAVTDEIKRRLCQLKETLPAEAFVRDHGDTVIAYGLASLLNGLDYIPTTFVRALTRGQDSILPVNQTEYSEARRLEGVKGGVIHRDYPALVGATLVSPEVIERLHIAAEPDAPLGMQYLAELEAAELTVNLDPDHWLMSQVIDDPDTLLDDQIRVTAHGRTLDAKIPLGNFSYSYFEARIAETIRLDGPLGSVETDSWLFDDPNGKKVMVGCAVENDAIKAVVSYYDGDDERIDEEQAETEGLQLSNTVQSLWTGPSALLKQAIHQSRISTFECLANQSFSVSFDADGAPCVELA